jgi:hypothetical protein
MGEQWRQLAPLMDDLPRRADDRGRPWRGSRAAVARHSVDLAHRRLPVASSEADSYEGERRRHVTVQAELRSKCSIET